MTTNADELAATATAGSDSGDRETAVVRGPGPAALGRFRLERVLGEGGMGVVHAAYDPELERRVALKVLRSHTSSDARARLLREAKAMARLAHPNVVTVHDVGTADGRDYVAMELVDGDNLATWLRDGRRSRAEILDVFVGAGRGLAAAHAAGLVHRDFKPHNVLRSRAGRVQVTDFGLARKSGRDAGSLDVRPDVPIQVTLTATGSVLGTPAYMAPEQWRGDSVGPAADQFAFCVALWEALAGERPYRGESTDELRAQAERGPATLDAAKIPRRLRPLLRRGLDPDPDKRWPSMDVVIAALEPRRRAPWIAIALTIVLTGVAFLVIDQVRSKPAAEAPALDDAVMSVQRISGGVVMASPAAIDKLLAEIRTQKTAKFVPAIEDEDEGPMGFKLYAIKRGSMLDAIGLSNGDVLTGLGEQPVTSVTDLERVGAQLTSTQAFRMAVMRGDEESAIVITPRY
ncbi:MAG: protein kinase [Kofleriaceae bacterium]|nr:protein kinase [Kofleriaceae bacterium]